jgi:uncharacterized protein (DUF2345 family)
MATSQNRNKTRVTPTAKQNYTGTRFGNDHGSISFGHIASDAAVTSDVQIQASDGRHSIILDKDGTRKGCTQITAPGRISIQSGEDRQEAEDTLFINAWNGNIDIIASNGKIRMQGTDIELIAFGEKGSKGNIIMEASENIKLDADNKVLINAGAMYKLATPGEAQICANSAMTIYSDCIRGVTAGCSVKDSKNAGKKFYEEQQKK